MSLQDEDSEFTLATDFEIGHFFRERIVPRAVLYFTGEALEDDESVGSSELLNRFIYFLNAICKPYIYMFSLT